MLRLFALACFFLSGTTGLMYQVLWTRFMGGIIGNTHFSITIVVAVFMGGLAIGSYAGGRVADRASRPFRLYGWITVAAGIACLLVPFAAHIGRPIFGFLYGYYEGRPEAPLLLTARIVFCAALLLVPTTLMGATLPALARYFTRRLDEVGSTVGMLYTVNTLGAVFGAAFAGFAAIPLLGLWGCTLTAVVVDLGLGMTILILSRNETRIAVAAHEEKPTSSSGEAETRTRLPGPVRMALVAFGVSGFANMLLQIAWTKALILTIGNSTYAFSLIVTLFILGIAIGGGVVSAFIDRVKNLSLALGVVIFATGVSVAWTIPELGFLPVVGARAFDRIAEPTYGKFLFEQVWIVSAVILPSTILMGMVFPIVGKIRTRALERVGSAVGSAYFWNTLGSILGTLTSGFVLIPLLGRVYSTLYIGAGLSLALGLVLLASSMPARVAVRGAIVAGLTVVVLAWGYATRPAGVLGSENFSWHPSLLSRGAYAYYENSYYDLNGNVIAEDDYAAGVIAYNDVLLYKEGVHAPVAIVRHSATGETAMRISGKVEASAAADGGYNNDLPHQIMAGHLPMLLHPQPKRVLTLGLGGGVTLGTLTLYPEVEAIDSLEISPEVVDAAGEYFAGVNRGAITNSIVRHVVGDGRNHIEYTDQMFDVITSVPSNPWIAGIGNLFTVEFFEACRARLAEGGILCNWIHKINMRDEDFRTVARTFSMVFGEHAQLWDFGLDCMLIGSLAPVTFDQARFAASLANPEIANDLANLGVTDTATFLKHFRLDTAGLRRFAGAGVANSDNFPVLEFSCPHGLYGHTWDAYGALTQAGRAELTNATWISGVAPETIARSDTLQEAFLRFERVRVAEDHLADEVARLRRAGKPLNDPRLLRAAQGIMDSLVHVEASLRVGRDPWLEKRANAIAAKTFGISPSPTLAGTISRQYLIFASKQSGDGRLRWLEAALPFAHADPEAPMKHGQLWLSVQRPGRAIPLVEKDVAAHPKDARRAQLLGTLYAASGRSAEGLRELERALSLATDKAVRSQILQNRGFTLERAGDRERAAEAYRAALAENPANENARKLLEALGLTAN